MEDKRILVTGAAGFIGSNLVRELLRKGNRVVCLVRPGESISRIQGLDCRIIHGDLLQKSSLPDAVAGADYIFHLAALLGRGTPEEIFHINYEGTKNLVEACRERGESPERFLFVSSTAAVGPSGKNCILNDSSPCQPVSVYGRSKLLAEEFLASLKNNFPFTIVRLPLVYGPGSDGGLYIFFKLLSKGIRFEIANMETTICFVWDAVQGMIDAAVNVDTLGKTYILGENKIYHFQQICDIISSVLEKRPFKIKTPYLLIYGMSVLFEIYSKLANSVPLLTRAELKQYYKYRYWRFETGRASRDFGYQSRYPLEKGAQITSDWYRQRGLI